MLARAINNLVFLSILAEYFWAEDEICGNDDPKFQITVAVPDTVLHATFRGMGSVVEVEVVGGSPGHLALARDRIAFLEARWSRFLPQSDISRLNAAQGEPVVVEQYTLDLIEAMVHGYTITDGAFDPTLLAPLVKLGYASSWHDPTATTELPAGVQPRGPIRGVTVDANASTARLPPGTAIDPGGIGKGMAADVVAELLVANGAAGALVSVGGDVRVLGEGPVDGGWLVAVDDAFRPEVEESSVWLRSGGLGSTGVRRRSWMTESGVLAHHLLDPADCTPLPTGLDDAAHATVLASKAVWAEVHATMVMVRGSLNSFARLDQTGVGARVVNGSGETLANASWPGSAPRDRPY